MNKISFLPTVLAGASIALVASVLPASAISLTPLITNVSDNYTDISSQFGLELTAVGTNQVSFTFTNNGPTASSITDIYFGKNTNPGFSTYLSGGTFTDTPGVNFELGANPPQPQGGITWESVYKAQSESGRPGVMNNGINPGETLSFTFNLNFNTATAQLYTVNDIYNAFQGINSPLAIAFHVQGLPTGQSDWYGTSNVTPTDVPEPFTMLGTGAALGFSALFQRERNKRQKAQAKA